MSEGMRIASPCRRNRSPGSHPTRGGFQDAVKKLTSSFPSTSDSFFSTMVMVPADGMSDHPLTSKWCSRTASCISASYATTRRCPSIRSIRKAKFAWRPRERLQCQVEQLLVVGGSEELNAVTLARAAKQLRQTREHRVMQAVVDFIDEYYDDLPALINSTAIAKNRTIPSPHTPSGISASNPRST